MDLRNLIRINKNLPRPIQKVLGSEYCLNFTTEMGFRLEIDHKLQNQIFDYTSSRLIINDKTIIFGIDSSIHCFGNKLPKDCLIVGDGVLLQKNLHHISSPWSFYIWITEFPKKSRKVVDRKGWVCSMHMKKQHRDQICLAISKKYMKLFEYQNHFCYDFGGEEFKHLEGYMFRSMFTTTENEMFDQQRTYRMIKNNANIKSDYMIEALMAPWHDSALLELVPETSCDIFFLTEKTIKPIAAGMPFVVMSCVKFLYHLRKLGFKTFHPYIDESYDFEKDQTKRIDMSLKSANDFLANPQNLDKIQQICDHNRQTLKKIRTYSWSKQIWKKLRKYITLG